jgi:parvulin-like peptidyl-prolyl isomerase
MEHPNLKKNPANDASPAENPDRLGRKGLLVTIAVFFIIVLLIIGIPYYRYVLAPRHQTILQVGKTSYTTLDLIKRLRLNPSESGINQLESATRLLQEMMNLELTRQEALKQKIIVPEQVLNREIQRRVMASAPGEEKFEDRYGAMLRRAGLKEKEFRTWVELDIYRGLLFQNFLKKMPENAEHIHLMAIVAPPGNKAEMIRTSLQKGQDFSRLAAEASTDLESARKGGDLGWIPKGVDEMITPGQIRGLVILTKTKPEAEKVREKILSGGNFADLARADSLDRETREKGGQTGWVSADFQEGKSYTAEAFELNPGEVSRPISGPEGFWIFKLIEKTPRGKVIDDIAFNLPIGQVSPPLNTVKGIYFLKVIGEEPQRPLSEDHRSILANKAFLEWLASIAQKGAAEGWIKWNWGSETYNWVITHLN